MSAELLLIWIAIGAIAGFLAGLIVKGYGFGLFGNIVVGILGAVVAGYLFPTIGFNVAPGVPGAIVSATIGAVVLLVAIGLVRRVA